jgi:hypothetical protein
MIAACPLFRALQESLPAKICFGWAYLDLHRMAGSSCFGCAFMIWPIFTSSRLSDMHQGQRGNIAKRHIFDYLLSSFVVFCASVRPGRTPKCCSCSPLFNSLAISNFSSKTSLHHGYSGYCLVILWSAWNASLNWFCWPWRLGFCRARPGQRYGMLRRSVTRPVLTIITQ